MALPIPEFVVADKRLGRNLNHDPRSKAYRLRAVPERLISVNHFPDLPCLDQGDVGSCVANTGTELLATEAFGKVRPSGLDETYAQTLYHDLTVADPYPGTWQPDDTGSDGLTLGKVLVTRGLASGYQHAMDMASFLAALQTTAVPIGITWKSGCDTPNSQGLIRWTGSMRGGHELLAIAYDADRGWVMLQNHWSTSWGLGGRCWISVADLTLALQSEGDATIIVPASSPAPVPTPAPVDADAVLWDATRTWAHGRHTGSNKTAATAISVWAASKNLT